MNNILRSENNESMQNRNNAKIAFLEHEIKQYDSLNNTLLEALRLKKASMSIYAKDVNAAATSSTAVTMRNSRIIHPQKVQMSSSQYSNRQFMRSSDAKETEVRALAEENMRLLQEFQAISEDRNNAQSKVLIAQQVSEEMDYYQQDLLVEEEDSLLELRRILQDKEGTVSEFEKKKPILFPSGVTIKWFDVIKANDQFEKVSGLHGKSQVALEVLKKYAQILTDESHKMEVTEEFTGFELIKLKHALKNPVNLQRLACKQISQFEMAFIHNLQLHCEYENYSKSKEVTNSLIAKQRAQSEILALNEKVRKIAYGKNNEQEKSQKCEESKGSANKEVQVEKQKLSDKQQQLPQQLQINEEIQRNRRLFQREELNDRLLDDEIQELTNQRAALLQQYELLSNSNQMHAKAVSKLKQMVGFYGVFHSKLEEVRIKKANHLSALARSFDRRDDQNSGYSKMEVCPISPNKEGNKTKVKKSGCESQCGYGSEMKRRENDSVDLDISQCREFLRNLAEDLKNSLGKNAAIGLSRYSIRRVQEFSANHFNSNINSDAQHKGVLRRHHRSLSNLIEYSSNTQMQQTKRLNHAQTAVKEQPMGLLESHDVRRFENRRIDLEEMSNKNTNFGLNNNNNNNGQHQKQSLQFTQQMRSSSLSTTTNVTSAVGSGAGVVAHSNHAKKNSLVSRNGSVSACLNMSESGQIGMRRNEQTSYYQQQMYVESEKTSMVNHNEELVMKNKKLLRRKKKNMHSQRSSVLKKKDQLELEGVSFISSDDDEDVFEDIMHNEQQRFQKRKHDRSNSNNNNNVLVGIDFSVN